MRKLYFNPLDASDKSAVVFPYVALVIICFYTLILLHLMLAVNKLGLKNRGLFCMSMRDR